MITSRLLVILLPLALLVSAQEKEKKSESVEHLQSKIVVNKNEIPVATLEAVQEDKDSVPTSTTITLETSTSNNSELKETDKKEKVQERETADTTTVAPLELKAEIKEKVEEKKVETTTTLAVESTTEHPLELKVTKNEETTTEKTADSTTTTVAPLETKETEKKEIVKNEKTVETTTSLTTEGTTSASLELTATNNNQNVNKQENSETTTMQSLEIKAEKKEKVQLKDVSTVPAVDTTTVVPVELKAEKKEKVEEQKVQATTLQAVESSTGHPSVANREGSQSETTTGSSASTTSASSEPKEVEKKENEQETTEVKAKQTGETTTVAPVDVKTTKVNTEKKAPNGKTERVRKIISSKKNKINRKSKVATQKEENAITDLIHEVVAEHRGLNRVQKKVLPGVKQNRGSFKQISPKKFFRSLRKANIKNNKTDASSSKEKVHQSKRARKIHRQTKKEEDNASLVIVRNGKVITLNQEQQNDLDSIIKSMILRDTKQSAL